MTGMSVNLVAAADKTTYFFSVVEAYPANILATRVLPVKETF